MQPFRYVRAEKPEAAVRLATTAELSSSAPGQFLAGGTTLIDLMKLGVMQPQMLVDVNPLRQSAAGRIEVVRQGLRLGALVSMSDAAEHEVIRSEYPVLSQSLLLAASQQLRNMATLGGNVLQRTRCHYFRDPSFVNCNKRQPGSGCAALDGMNRLHAVLGTSTQCIASYPGDFAQALIALDASVQTLGPSGVRTFAFSQLHESADRTPPHTETRLKPGELITSFIVPAGPHTRRSLYLKIRDRASYAFALVSTAVALHLEGDRVRDVRIALGGVATRPWRATESEQLLRGQALNEELARRAAKAAFATARTSEHNAFKVPLTEQVVVRALIECQRLEVEA
jgi:xanthine dehydrogenase YagS FAD-binding subunit